MGGAVRAAEDAARAVAHAVAGRVGDGGPVGLDDQLHLSPAAAAVPAVAATARDLERRPPTADELAHVDAVILDPPRRGAEAVAVALAASDVGRVVHVSCAPVTFAREAATLVAAGFRLDRVGVVDQFRFSPAVELVGVFARP